jgi:Protein of unknown function (DUF998)
MRPSSERITVSGSSTERSIRGTMTTHKTTLWLLKAGIAVPLLYYGIQVAAAPFFPDFSFVRTTASELGSDSSPFATPFNLGITSIGVCSLIASIGFLLALRRTNPILAWFIFLALAITGVQSVWAGYYSIPDPRHGGHPAFIVLHAPAADIAHSSIVETEQFPTEGISRLNPGITHLDGPRDERNQWDRQASLPWRDPACLYIGNLSTDWCWSVCSVEA